MHSLWALPGFLGLPSDWDFLKINQTVGVDLSLFPLTGLHDWAKCFNKHALLNKSKPAVLMGYSLGGRLALHALLDATECWDAAIIISTHSGLKTEDERKKRLLHDQEWAVRFISEDWRNLMTSWHSQKIFNGDSFHFERFEKDFRRSFLKEALTHASLGNQDDLKCRIADLPMPLLWITGENDHKFSEIADNLDFSNPLSRHIVIANSGHRVPWEEPDLFKQHVQNFIAESTL